MSVTHTVLHGDCLERLRELPDNSVDSCVTDPPYGLSKEPNIAEVLSKWLAGEPYDHGHGGFMGKAWDSFVPHPDVWREVYRVLKPGGHALVFAGTRTQDLMTVSLRMAGFEVRDVIEWLYFSGFPKSMDVGKQLDKLDAKAARRSRDLRFTEWMRSTGLTSRQINDSTNSNMASHYLTDKEQPAVATRDMFELFRPLLTADVPAWVEEMVDERTIESENYKSRKKIGESTNAIAGGTGMHTGNEGAYGFNAKFDITAPATELARKWDGWGTALKPAHEPIIVVRKPLIGTVADNVVQYGTGAVNINSCRIEKREGDRTEYGVAGIPRKTGNIYGEMSGVHTYEGTIGRFPTNCITTDDDAFYSPYFNVTPADVCKKASKRDRGEGNTHPTVKPTDLMAWLVRLVTPPNGTVLDPFAGSGSTLVAAKREGFGFIGIEREFEYIEIIEARTEVVAS